MQAGDLPDETDWNNDGRSDIVYYRPTSKQEFVRIYNPSNNTITVTAYNRFVDTSELDPATVTSHNYQSSTPGGPSPGGELSVRIPLNTTSHCGTSQAVYKELYDFIPSPGNFGSGTCIFPISLQDVTVIGNFGGSAVDLADFARWTPGSGMWTIYYNTNGGYSGSPNLIPWGLNGDIPVGFVKSSSGISWPAVYRPSEGNWYINNQDSQSGCPGAVGFLTHPGLSTCVQQWGLSTDIPVY
jgi:hypothetical protein